ncbi:hypothetical protein [Kosakonia sacchari]
MAEVMSKNIVNNLFLLLFLIWLTLYLFCTEIPYIKAFKPDDIRIPLNVFFAVVALVITYVDRYLHYQPLQEKPSQLPETKGLFLPLGLAILPVTSSLTDLGYASPKNVFIPSFALLMLGGLTMVEAAFICNFQQSRKFAFLFITHILFACIFISAALLYLRNQLA